MQLGNQKRGNKWFARCWLGAPTRRMTNTTELAGIECRACGRRTLVPFDGRVAGLNGSARPVFGLQCQGCDSTDIVWRRFITLAELNAWMDGARLE